MINPIENEELAVSVRAKLNQAIASINDLNPKADLLDSILFGSTPPATRRDCSPLQIGDRLIKPNGLNYSWNGALWLGERRTFGSVVIDGWDVRHFVDPSHGIFWESVFLVSAQPQYSAPNWDASNAWKVASFSYAGASSFDPLVINEQSGYSIGKRIYREYPINMALIPTDPVGGGSFIFIQIRQIGEPSDPSLFLIFNVRPILL